MQTVQAAFMGIAQGISEFLPISSSAHIVFTSTIYKILTGTSIQNVGSEEIFFDIIIHLASLFAVIIFFFKDLKALISGTYKSIKEKNYTTPEFQMGKYVLYSTLITCIIGFFIKDIAHKLTENPLFVSILLLITGFVLYFSEKLKQQQKELNTKISILIGLAQGLAIFPGLSRSGLTIATGVFNGLNRTYAAKFSFILSIPIILIASLIYPMLELDITQIQHFNLKAIIIGSLLSFITGYMCIKFFMKFLEKFSLQYFAYYCWSVGIIMIFVSTLAN